MNESRNNSILSTVIFLCIAALLIFGTTLLSEKFTATKPNNINNTSTQTK